MDYFSASANSWVVEIGRMSLVHKGAEEKINIYAVLILTVILSVIRKAKQKLE